MILYSYLIILQFNQQSKGGILLQFKDGINVFRYRGVAVAIENNHVLLHKQEKHDYWSLPGGRCEFHETSRETVVREIEEELHEKVEAPRLFWFCENFYATPNHKYHEIALYYEIKFNSNSQIMDFSKTYQGKEIDARLIFKWFPIDQLHKINVKPEFLVKSLQNIPDHVEHIITRN